MDSVSNSAEMTDWSICLKGTKKEVVSVRFTKTIGTLRSDNGEVHENVADKQTTSFQLFRDYPSSPCYVKEEDFGWS